MEKPVVIMDFSHIYQEEDFYRNENYQWLNCSDIKGTNCYCSYEGELEIAKRMEVASPFTLHFIDSGNYHYVSKLWLERIDQPFILIIFDHHPDMQAPTLGPITSCGGWVEDVLETNPYIQQTYLLGVKGELVKSEKILNKENVKIYTEEDLLKKEKWVEFEKEHWNYPIYISIDKDVLNKKDVITNWDQGLLRLEQLKRLVKIILRKGYIIGGDIGGEYDYTSSYTRQCQPNLMNNKANYELLTLFEKNWKEYSY